MSLDTKKYHTGTLKKYNVWEGESSKYSRDIGNSYFSTLNKNRGEERKGPNLQVKETNFRRDNLFSNINSIISFKKSKKPTPTHLYNHKFQLSKYDLTKNPINNFKSFSLKNNSLLSLK